MLCFCILINILYIFSINALISDNVIDMDDILSKEFMPGALLMLENPKSFSKNLNESIPIVEGSSSINTDGTIFDAMNTMGFHRSKMNEYLCRNYVAEQIINDMTLSRIKRRMGSDSPLMDITSNKIQIAAVRNNLLQDEGSSNYKDWLSKSTTLEDIYRHYNDKESKVDKRNDDSDGKDEEINEDYDTSIAGFNYHQQNQPPHPIPGPPSKVDHSGGGGGYFHGGNGGYPSYHGSSSQSGYGGNYGDSGGGHSGYSVHEPVHEQPKYHQVYHEESHSEKEHDLSDLFDIALTALAFLAFKMFLIHVVLCITTATNTSTTTAASMMMPMSMSPTATGPNMNGDGGGGGGAMTSTGGGGDDGGMAMTGGGDAGTGGDGGVTGEGNDAGGDEGNGGGDEGGGDNTGGDGGTGGGDDGGAEGGDNGGTGGGDDGGGDADAGGDEGNTDDNSPGTGTGTGTGTGGTGTGGGDTGTGTGGTGTGTGTGKDTLNIRLPRDIPKMTGRNNQLLNELARRVLASIDAAFLANEDDGNCLRKILCENNRYSRKLEGNNKILIPLWSLGMSWLSGRLAKKVNPATSMLDTLKSSILGLGKANCEIIYQQCNLRQQRKERKLKRRKRQT